MKRFLKNIIFFVLSPFVVKKYNSNNIYITFDDGPHPENTIKIIDILDTFKIQASFFMSGTEMEKYPDVVKNLYESGHSLCYHGYIHNHANEKTMSSLKIELDKVGEFEKKHGVIFKKLYRPPYGELTVPTLLQLILSGWKIILWSVDSRDSFDGVDEILENVSSKNISPGDIILLHDDYSKTKKLLAKILQHYQETGFKCGALN